MEKKSKILIISNDKDDRDIIERCLNKSDYQRIYFAEKGEEGVEKVLSLNPKVVVIDLILPDISGFEVCRRIKKAAGKDAGLKIIMMTGFVDAIDAVEARRSGADDYCVKTSECMSLIEALSGLDK